MTLNRYTPGGVSGLTICMRLDSDGNYIRYENYKKLQSKIQELQMQINYLKVNDTAKNQITQIKKKVIAFQTANDNALEQILDDLKLIKIYC